MKRFWLIGLLLGLAVLLGFSVSAEEAVTASPEAATVPTDLMEETAETAETTETEEAASLPRTPEEWIVYIKEELIPLAVAILTAVAAVYVAISPILAKIKRASERFRDATADVNTATGTVRRNEKRIAEAEERFSERLAAMEAENHANREELQDIKEMLRLGLGNLNELVNKGQAYRILRIGKGERQSVIEEEEARESERQTKM